MKYGQLFSLVLFILGCHASGNEAVKKQVKESTEQSSFLDCKEKMKNFTGDKNYVKAFNDIYRSKLDSSLRLLTCSYDGELYLRELSIDIDLSTAVEQGEFLYDKKNLYGYHSTSDGDMLYKIENVDISSLEILGNSIYAKDKNFVYSCRHGIIKEADASSFMLIYQHAEDKGSAYGKDNSNYFFWNEIISDSVAIEGIMAFENKMDSLK